MERDDVEPAKGGARPRTRFGSAPQMKIVHHRMEAILQPDDDLDGVLGVLEEAEKKREAAYVTARGGATALASSRSTA